MQIEGDYEEILSYYANLFSIKKQREIQVDEYTFNYLGCRILDTDGKEVEMLFPPRELSDRVIEIRFSVRSLGGVEPLVSVTWDRIRVEPEPDQRELRRFLDRLDTSTFRFF